MAKKKVDMNSKAAKYFMANVIEGKTKTQAAKEAGISTVKNTHNMEQTQTYQMLAAKYKDALEQAISKETIAEELKKNILQDSDKGAKNTAIKIFLDKVEPEAKAPADDERMIVVMRG